MNASLSLAAVNKKALDQANSAVYYDQKELLKVFFKKKTVGLESYELEVLESSEFYARMNFKGFREAAKDFNNENDLRKLLEILDEIYDKFHNNSSVEFNLWLKTRHRIIVQIGITMLAQGLNLDIGAVVKSPKNIQIPKTFSVQSYIEAVNKLIISFNYYALKRKKDDSECAKLEDVYVKHSEINLRCFFVDIHNGDEVIVNQSKLRTIVFALFGIYSKSIFEDDILRLIRDIENKIWPVPRRFSEQENEVMFREYDELQAKDVQAKENWTADQRNDFGPYTQEQTSQVHASSPSFFFTQDTNTDISLMSPSSSQKNQQHKHAIASGMDKQSEGKPKTKSIVSLEYHQAEEGRAFVATTPVEVAPKQVKIATPVAKDKTPKTVAVEMPVANTSKVSKSNTTTSNNNNNNNNNNNRDTSEALVANKSHAPLTRSQAKSNGATIDAKVYETIKNVQQVTSTFNKKNDLHDPLREALGIQEDSDDTAEQPARGMMRGSKRAEPVDGSTTNTNANTSVKGSEKNKINASTPQPRQSPVVPPSSEKKGRSDVVAMKTQHQLVVEDKSPKKRMKLTDERIPGTKVDFDETEDIEDFSVSESSQKDSDYNPGDSKRLKPNFHKQVFSKTLNSSASSDGAGRVSGGSNSGAGGGGGGGGSEVRGKRSRWSDEEETCLIEGIAKYGEGHWVDILGDSYFGQVLRNRSNVNLKDKCRTMKHHGII